MRIEFIIRIRQFEGDFSLFGLSMNYLHFFIDHAETRIFIGDCIASSYSVNSWKLLFCHLNWVSIKIFWFTLKYYVIFTLTGYETQEWKWLIDKFNSTGRMMSSLADCKTFIDDINKMRWKRSLKWLTTIDCQLNCR